MIIGSARINEKGSVSGGKAGDQKQTSADDYSGEVSLQQFYVHKKGWYVIRSKSIEHATLIAQKMIDACANKNIGYDQGDDRLGVIKYGIDSKVPTGADCGSLVRACVKEATGIDPGNFNTTSEPTALINTGLFEPIFTYYEGCELFVGDILVTKTKGHTVIVCYGNKRKADTKPSVEYYPKCNLYTVSIVAALESVGEKDTSLVHRKKIGAVNGITGVGSAKSNEKMLKLLKEGKLIKA